MEFKDHPNARSSHNHHCEEVVFPLLLFLVFSLLLHSSQVANFTFVVFPCRALAFVGLIDDRYNLPSLWRYCFHIFTAISLLFSPLLVLDISTSTFAFFLNCILILLAIWIINLPNFMDGLDGLVAGCMSVAFSSIILVLDLPPLMWTLVGSLLGFLFFN